MGTLDIASNVAGAKILIDGTLKDGWLTPHSAQLPAGKYRVSLVADNYQATFQEVVVTAGNESAVKIELAAESGVLRIETTPPGLEVFIDEKSYGASPATASIPAGSHNVRVSPPPGGAPLVKTVQVRADATSTLRFSW